MKSLTLLPILSAALLLTACGQSTSLPATVSAPALVQRYQAPAANQQVLVRFRPDASRTALGQFNGRYGLRTVNYNSQLNVYVMEVVNPRANLGSLISAMSRDAAVIFAEINQQIKVSPVVDMQVKPILN
ncbi:MAG: hypothetical protein AB7I41_11080 [Candidatus Sericytochromatia bacterium]